MLLFVILAVLLVLGVAIGTYVMVKHDRPAKAPDSPLRPAEPAGWRPPVVWRVSHQK